MRNRRLRFSEKFIHMRVEQTGTPFTRACSRGEVLKVPIAHGDGNYYNFDAEIQTLEDNGQIVFRYCDSRGEITDEANPNGSLHGIAGIINEQGNVLGLMPHPERAVESILGSADGLKVFESIRLSIGSGKAVKAG